MILKLFGNISKIMLSATFVFLFLACAEAQPANLQTAAAPTAKSSTDSDTLKNVRAGKFGKDLRIAEKMLSPKELDGYFIGKTF